MDNREAIEMMQRCLSEVQQQRRQIEAMTPRAEAYEVIRDIVRMLPQPSQGCGEDLTWILRKRIQELQPKPKPEEVEPRTAAGSLD